MRDILNIIPLSPGITMFEFIEKDKNMKIFIGQKDYNFFFDNIESFSKVQNIVISISEGEEDLFDDDDIIKVSESLYNDKIMGGKLTDTPLFCKSKKDLAILELKIENLKRAKMRAEKKGKIYYNLNIENGNENITIQNEDNIVNNNNNLNDDNIINNKDSDNNNFINNNQDVNEENKAININSINNYDDSNNNEINGNDNKLDINNIEDINNNKEDEKDNNENKNDDNDDNKINNNNNIENNKEES
jgi:hypothetical protein